MRCPPFVKRTRSQENICQCQTCLFGGTGELFSFFAYFSFSKISEMNHTHVSQCSTASGSAGVLIKKADSRASLQIYGKRVDIYELGNPTSLTSSPGDWEPLVPQVSTRSSNTLHTSSKETQIFHFFQNPQKLKRKIPDSKCIFKHHCYHPCCNFSDSNIYWKPDKMQVLFLYCLLTIWAGTHTIWSRRLLERNPKAQIPHTVSRHCNTAIKNHVHVRKIMYYHTQKCFTAQSLWHFFLIWQCVYTAYAETLRSYLNLHTIVQKINGQIRKIKLISPIRSIFQVCFFQRIWKCDRQCFIIPHSSLLQ